MSKFFAFQFIIIFFVLVRVNYSANILCMFTSPVKNQLVIFMAVANTLIERGHNVTIVTILPIPQQSMPKKPFRHVFLKSHPETIRTLNEYMVEINNGTLSKFKVMKNILLTTNLFTVTQKNALEWELFRSFFKEDNHFDLMLLGYFHNDFMVGVAARYRCPVAIVSLAAPFGTINRMVGNPAETSYVQIPFFGKSQPMSFVERAKNFLWSAVEPLVHMYVDFGMEQIYGILFPDDSYPLYSDMISNISLVLYNRHFSEMPIRPLVPALVEIGGIQVEDQSDFLPQDIKEFLDASHNGSILFRVGSLARGTEQKPDQLKIILNVLSKLDQRTVWEWERLERPPNEFSNILFCSSITPNAILPHRNLKLYITDGRPLAIQEATYHGVPMFALPLFGDEMYAVAEMTNSGFGSSLDVNNLTEKTLNESLTKVLESPYYARKVKEFSQLFRDRPNTARETAAFWLEYVIRHRGAPHMQSPLVHLNFIKRWNIDVIVVLIVIVWAFVKMALLTGFIVRTIIDLRTERLKVKNKAKQL